MISCLEGFDTNYSKMKLSVVPHSSEFYINLPIEERRQILGEEILNQRKHDAIPFIQWIEKNDISSMLITLGDSRIWSYEITFTYFPNRDSMVVSIVDSSLSYCTNIEVHGDLKYDPRNIAGIIIANTNI